MKAGDEITVAYVDVKQHADETAMEARRRRRMELARGWRFACTCTLCTSEALANPTSVEGEVSQKDGSKIEVSVQHVELDQAAAGSGSVDSDP